jgi:uncharacterized protein (DUF302 family)
MKKTLGMVLSCMVAGLSAYAADNASSGQNDYTRVVERPYSEVLDAVKQAAQKEGFRVSNVHDIAASLKKDGIQREPYATVEVCNSKIAAQVLHANPLLGSVMPCRIAVFQKGSGTTVSMLLPSKMMKMFPPSSEIDNAAREVEDSMKKIVDEATAVSSNTAEQDGSGKNDYTKFVERPFTDVLDDVKQAAQKEGFRVSNVHDIAASLKKDGLQREPYATVEVCNSKIAAKVLHADPLLGSVMPCRIAVFQKGSGTSVSMLLPSRMMKMFPPSSEIDNAARQVEASMKKIIDEATKS